MKIQILYTLDCPWRETRKIVRGVLEELGVDARVEEILVDTGEMAKRYGFTGSPTVRIDEEDVQERISKERCLTCEEPTELVKRCRIYFYKGTQL